MLGKKFIILCFVVLCYGFHLFRSNKPITIDEANRYMWDQLHQGNYDSISQIVQKLRSALSQSPEDTSLNTHLGFIYLWKFGERARHEHDTTVFRNVFISNSFFKKAIELNPDDARLYSLQASTEISEGAIRNDSRQMKKGYLKGLEAVPKWPQFNRFALAAIESLLDKNTSMFRQGLRYQWITMDECSCKKLSKKEILDHPEKLIPELIAETQNSPDPKIKRACWNTWIAPHNFEGYFLNFGDMLVKKGYLEEARRIYSSIKLSPTYKDWPFQSVLEDRIKNAERYEIAFNKPLQLIVAPGSEQIFINSRLACTGCHQMSKHELETMKRENLSQ